MGILVRGLVELNHWKMVLILKTENQMEDLRFLGIKNFNLKKMCIIKTLTLMEYCVTQILVMLLIGSPDSPEKMW